MADETIRVVGIVDLQRALRQIDKEAPKELAAGLAKVSEFVVSKSKPKWPFLSGDAVGSLKPRKQQRGATIAIGGSRAEYAPWLNFGGRVGRNRSVSRPIRKPDYFLYSTVKENNAEIRTMVDAVLERMAVKAGFETTGKG